LLGLPQKKTRTTTTENTGTLCFAQNDDLVKDNKKDNGKNDGDRQKRGSG
jgi:hypothetical protein